jgi:anti-sigma factor RsiW
MSGQKQREGAEPPDPNRRWLVDDSRNEDELLAALLDGRLDTDMRVETLSRLTEDDETYAVFTSLAAILRETEAQDSRGDAAAPSVFPFRERRPRHGEAGWSAMKRRWIALAAALAGVALAPDSAPEVRTSFAGDPILLAARLEHASDGLPAKWNESPTWSSSR